MKIRIARDGKEIARLESLDMLGHLVNGKTVHADDHVLVEGGKDWIRVGDLLKTQVRRGGELNPAMSIDKAAEAYDPKSLTPQDGVPSERSKVTIENVVHPAPPKPKSAGGRVSRTAPYVLPTLFVALAILVALFGWYHRPRDTYGPANTLPVEQKTAFDRAVELAKEGDSLFSEATKKWWNEDEEKIKAAQSRYAQAWKQIHDGHGHPEGALISEDADVAILRDDLDRKIADCEKRTNWWPIF